MREIGSYGVAIRVIDNWETDVRFAPLDKTLGKRRELIESTLHCVNSTISQLPKLSPDSPPVTFLR